MVDYREQGKKIIENLKIGDIFISYNNYSYIYYIGIDENRKINNKAEYMFYSVTLYSGNSIIYYYTEGGVCIALSNYEKITRNILNKEIIFNMTRKILLKNTKLPEDVIIYINEFIN
jgi:hypothetical protein